VDRVQTGAHRHRNVASRSLAAAGLAVMLSLAFAAPVQAAASMQDAIALIDAGKFADARKTLDALAAESAGSDAAARDEIAFQRERMRRILLDFTLTQADVETQLRKEIPDLKAEEFSAWDQPTLLESLTIDGEKRYFARAVPNLFRVSAQARARRKVTPPSSDGPMENANAHHLQVIEHADTPIASRRVRVTQSIIVDADAVPAGETVRAWIPFPREIEGQQRDIVLLSTNPTPHQLAPASTLQRTVYLEKPAQTGQPTEFSVNYELTVLGRHHPIVPEKVVPAADISQFAEFLGERPPHIVFTPALRAYSKKIVGDETHPYRIAQKLFDAVDTIPWGSAREYSTITNISDYALHQGHADCGQQTLLLMTLLRLNGIPSRWQSGMVFSDGSYDNLHDWGQLYLAPYGWVPMDVTTGRLQSDDARVRDFYLGSLDAYRIAFNDDFSTAFVPPKQHMRSETVDSQRGEVEWRGGNLYYDQWDYRFEGKVLPASGATP
jgi:transglutaminase-like putative cysteine protease